LQAIYQWQLTQDDTEAISTHFLKQPYVLAIDQAFFRQLFLGVASYHSDLDQKINPFLNRPVDSVYQVERAILRIGAYELFYCPEVPYKVVINEAVELAKAFSANKSSKYINGILHQLAKQYRPQEV
jgi:transcription antitermination protein NusB